MGDPTVSFADASDVCRAPWRTEAEAREQAAILDAAGWRVDHRFPPAPFGHAGVLIVASVYDPVTFSSPGDVTYRAAAGAAAGERRHPVTDYCEGIGCGCR